MSLPNNQPSSHQNGRTTFLTEETVRRFQQNQGYVYLIHAIGTDRYKIGRSVNPIARLGQLSKRQAPYPLQIVECFWTPDAVFDEKKFHEFFSSARVHGEWFRLNHFTEEELNANDCEIVNSQAYDESVNCFGYYTRFARPQILATANVFAETLSLQILSKRPEILDCSYSEGLTPKRLLYSWIKEELHEAFGDCNSLDSFIRICRFAEEDWCRVVDYSNYLSYSHQTLKIALSAALRGFVVSLTKGVS